MYTGNPCPYSVYARALLDSKKIPYQEINVWEDESKRAEMLKKSEKNLCTTNFYRRSSRWWNAEHRLLTKVGKINY